MLENKEINFLKCQIAKVSHKSKEGHVASAYSIIDLVWVLYKNILNVEQISNGISHKFILIKGHASLALYAVFLSMGYISQEEFDTFCEYGSKLGGHPDSNKLPQIEASTGSLGHGLPIAVGMAMALNIKKNISRVYCLVGDGECNEGSIWEAVLLATQHRLGNLCCIVDYNHSTDRALLMGDIAEKFSAFGWEAIVIDGHNHKEILNAYMLALLSEKPMVIIANTIKGKGIKLMENSPEWHHKSPSIEELSAIYKELGYAKAIC